MKKIIFSLFVSLCGLVSFGYCNNFDDYSPWINFITGDYDQEIFTFTCPTTSSSYIFNSVYDFGASSSENAICFHIFVNDSFPSAGITARIDSSSTATKSSIFPGPIAIESFNNSYIDNFNDSNIVCFNGNKRYFGFACPKAQAGYTFYYQLFYPDQLFSYNGFIEYYSGYNSCQSDLTTCQNSSCQSDLLQCQNDYSSCSNSLGNCGAGLNSCQSALGNCMQGNIGSGTNWSALFINDIQHIGNSIIDITIPEEISWDYLNTGDIFEIDIEGYNVDTEYIDNIIRTQNYKPTSEDFTELVGLLAPYSKIIIFCVFLFIVWAWIKKPFKSKKL